MGYAMIVHGWLRLDEARRERVAAAAVDPWSHEDWLGSLRPHGTPGRYTAGQVLDLLAEHHRLHVEWDDHRLTVGGVLPSDAFLDWGCHLVDVFRLAVAAGGEGELWFLEEQTLHTPQQPELCYRLTAAGGEARLAHPTRAEQEKVLATPEFTELVTARLLPDGLPGASA